MEEARYRRQPFLGENAQERFAQCTVGIVGLGGGGSHVVQQLAHIGFKRYVVYDADMVEDTNLNRLIGATLKDVKEGTPKVKVAQRMIVGLHDDADVRPIPRRWQVEAEPLRSCDLIFGCVDTFAERRDLEVCSRRYMIPYIDIGMDVNRGDDGRFVMGGQVILSMPGEPCMFCMGFLTDDRLAKEAARYGDVGGRPQVVWPNGVLASTAVGLAVDLLTDWSRSGRRLAYLSNRGNDHTLKQHVRMEYLQESDCPHYSLANVGDPVFTSVGSAATAE